MCGPYWSQWDKADLDDWQGKDLVVKEGEETDEEDRLTNPGWLGCHGCMECLGMSSRDFL